MTVRRGCAVFHKTNAHLVWQDGQSTVLGVGEAEVALDLLVEQTADGEQMRHALDILPHVLAHERAHQDERVDRRVEAVRRNYRNNTLITEIADPRLL